MNKKFYLLIFFSFFTSIAVIAQSVDMHFSSLGFLDNREYKDFVARSRTYSGTRIALDFGLNLDTLNSFVVGANAIHEFGAIPFFLNVDPVAYYKFSNKNWLFHIGEFPREGLLDNYPRALLNDTLQYYRPNIQGMFLRFASNNKAFTESLWIDWVSRQTDTQREEFLTGFEGKYQPDPHGPFYIKNYFMILHDAGAAILLPNDHIQDNGAAQIRLGLDFSHKTVFDSLSFEAGAMASLERTRGVDGLQTPKGFVASAYLSYWRLAVFEEYYAGQGSHIYFGDSFYEKKFYNRIDFIITPFVANRLKGQFVFTMHKTPGFTSNQEAFRLTYDLGSKVIARFKPI
ncbi:MAG: hypothetical protein ABI203_10455 [Mucilaginibacter sp.]